MFPSYLSNCQAMLLLPLLALLPPQDAGLNLPPVAFPDWPTSVGREAAYGERHLTNIRQLTFGGQNAEAYWNLDGTKLSYQTRQPRWPDEQIVTMNPDGTGKSLVSTGL